MTTAFVNGQVLTAQGFQSLDVVVEGERIVDIGPRAGADARIDLDGGYLLPGFIDARVLDVIDPTPAPGRIALCTQYLLRDEAALQAYFDLHAARLRGDGIARFDGSFNASRRILRAP